MARLFSVIFRYNILPIILSCSCVFPVQAATEGQKATGVSASETTQNKASAGRPFNAKAALTYYFDSRDYNTLAIFTSIDELPLGFKIWGFTDLHGDQGNASDRFDITRHFIEYRLSREISPEWLFGLQGVGMMAEYNDFNGPDNDLVRIGPYYDHAIPLPFSDRQGKMQWRLFPYESDGSGWQASVSFFVPFSDRVSLTGFADINVIDGSDRWVVEPQLNFKVSQQFSLVMELRYNGFEEANPDLDGLGLTAGLKLSF